MDRLKGTVDYILYSNPENGFTVAKIIPDKSKTEETVVLKTIDLNKGMCLDMEGEWKDDSRYGKEFIVSKYEEVLPTTNEGIKMYLCSGLVKGIGPVYAKKIVDHFKGDTLRILSEEPDRLREIKGLGKLKCETIKKSWKEHEEIRNVMIYFKSFNIPTYLIIKIIKRYGKDAVSIIQENPYIIVKDIEGIGFKKADEIALKIGFTMTSSFRIEAGIIYTMTEDCENGDTYLDREDIISMASELLSVEKDVVFDALENLTAEKELINDDNSIYLPWLYYAEKKSADKVNNILNYDFNFEDSVDIKRLELITGIEYDEKQIEAITMAYNNNFSIITGGPGTGKTTITNGIVELLKNEGKMIALASPTGKAAKRLSEATGMEASTIHRLLEYNPEEGFKRNGDNPLTYDVIIIDESSMINIELFYRLMSAVQDHMKLIFIGDVDQLPCIGSGNVLRDLINSEKIPVTKLNKIFRQSQDSNIIVNAHNIRNGHNLKVDNKKESDFFYLNVNSDIDVEKNVLSLIKERLPKAYNIKSKDIQVLTPMKNPRIGTINLNNEIQELINPNGETLVFNNIKYKKGDKVIQTVNNYDKNIFNGDTGIITEVNSEEKVLFVNYDDRIIEYNSSDLDELSLSYALTIHKSQGSEYPYVIIPISNSNMTMMERNLIYTAITRAKKLCIVIGPWNTLCYGIVHQECHMRKTKLKERIF